MKESAISSFSAVESFYPKMYRFKTLTAAVVVAAARRSLRLNPALPSLSRTYASRYAAEKGKIRDGANVRKVLPPHLQSDNVATLTCESSASGAICDVYLVGTCTTESKREVENLIHFLIPEVVFLEQCPTQLIEENRLPGGFDPHSVRVKSAGKDILEVAIKRVGEKKITQRRFKSATFWDLIKNKYYKKYSKESLSHKLIKSKLKENHHKVIVDERDQYMSVKLLEAARQHSSVVIVVGRAHLEGIQENWKQPVELEQLLVIPKDLVIVVRCVLAPASVSALKLFIALEKCYS